MYNVVRKALLLITALGIMAYSHAQSWVQVTGIPPVDVYALQTDQHTIYAGTADRLYTGLNNGEWWIASSPLGNVGSITDIALFSGKIYVGTYKAGVFRSSDQGTTWTSVSNGISSINSISNFLIWNGNLYAATYGEGVFKFDEGTSQWSSFNNGLYQIDYNVWQLITSDSTLVATTGANGDFYRYDTVGHQWQYFYYNSVGLQPGLFANTFLADGHSLLAGFSGSRSFGLLRSDNGGRNWYTDTIGLGRYFNARVAFASLNQLVAGAKKDYAVINTFAGVNGSNIAWLLSRNKGAAAGTRWDSLASFNTNRFMYTAAESGGRLYVALDTGLYYKQITPEPVPNTPPNASMVIYPNPVKSTATVAVSLPSPQKITLRLLGIDGKLLAVPYAGYALNAGTQLLTIDLGGFSAACYLLQISTDSRQQTERLIKAR